MERTARARHYFARGSSVPPGARLSSRTGQACTRVRAGSSRGSSVHPGARLACVRGQACARVQVGASRASFFRPILSVVSSFCSGARACARRRWTRWRCRAGLAQVCGRLSRRPRAGLAQVSRARAGYALHKSVSHYVPAARRAARGVGRAS